MLFRGGSPPSCQTGSISNITSQNTGNNRNDKGDADTSDTEIFLSSESERNKAEIVCWSDQQIQVLKKCEKSIKSFKIQ